MTPLVKLGAYVLALVVLLAGGFVAGRVLLPGDSRAGTPARPEPTVTPGGHGGAEHGGGEPGDQSSAGESDGHGGHASAGGGSVRGLSLEQDGFRLAGTKAPARPDQDGALSFMIMDPDGRPVTDFEVSHEKRLHLIVVRTDGTRFRHVHPVMAEDGTWTIPWRWSAAGSYRMFADFVPSASGTPTTLGYGFDVAGSLRPATATKISKSTTVDDYRVELSGDLAAGGESELTVTVTKGGNPVTTLEPYLGAYGHLVILREGDLGYLHVHPEGAEPEAGEKSGPEVSFVAQTPTPSRYLLYFDFQVAGKVRTAEFVLGTDPHDSDHDEDHGHSPDDQHDQDEQGER